MKKILLLLPFLLIFVQTVSFAQYDQKRMLYMNKVKTYNRMQTAGFIMVGAGVLATSAGVVLLASFDDTNQTDDDFEKAFFGVGGILLGFPLTAGGTVLAILGTHNKIKYSNYLKNMRVNIRYNQFHKGLVLRYQF